MAPAGVPRPLVGNNPIAIAIPRKSPALPIVLDMALSQTAFGRIRLAAAEGRDIPLGWACDARGVPTTDSREALIASLLAPVGGYKGYGLAIMIDILAGILIGAKFGADADAHSHRDGGVGHLALALEPSVFISRSRFNWSVDTLERELKSAPVASEGSEVLLPGELEARTRRRREFEGIPISGELVGQSRPLARPSPWGPQPTGLQLSPEGLPPDNDPGAIGAFPPAPPGCPPPIAVLLNPKGGWSAQISGGH